MLVQPLVELPGGGSLGGSDVDVLGRLRLSEVDRLSDMGRLSEPDSLGELADPLVEPDPLAESDVLPELPAPLRLKLALPAE